MKNLIRLIGGMLIFMAIVLFLYGSVKTYRAEQEEPATTELEPGITLVERSTQQNFAEYSFTAAAVSGILGLVVFLSAGKFSRKDDF
jgi:Ca2+/Na+ antiporter